MSSVKKFANPISLSFLLDNATPKWKAPFDGRLAWEPADAWMMHQGHGEVTSPCEVKAGDVFFVDGDDIHCIFHPSVDVKVVDFPQ